MKILWAVPPFYAPIPTVGKQLNDREFIKAYHHEKATNRIDPHPYPHNGC
jgi:hypothetical protein